MPAAVGWCKDDADLHRPWEAGQHIRKLPAHLLRNLLQLVHASLIRKHEIKAECTGCGGQPAQEPAQVVHMWALRPQDQVPNVVLKGTQMYCRCQKGSACSMVETW